MLGRHGLYVRESDCWIVFLFFKGTDLHSGSHPFYSPQALSAWMKQQDALNTMWEKSVNRVALVSYPTSSICNRVAPMSITPALHFLNLGEPNTYKAHQQNFSQHSRGILGSESDLRNRLGREAVYGLANYMKHAGLHIEGGIVSLLPKMFFFDKASSKQHLLPSPVDIDADPSHVECMRRLWAWHVTISSQYRIRMTKFAYSTEQQKHQKNHQQTGAFSIMENPSSIDLGIPPPSEESDLDIIVSEVVGRIRKDEMVSFSMFKYTAFTDSKVPSLFGRFG